MDELKIVREKREGYGTLKRFHNSADVFEAFRERFAQVDREEFLVLVLDAKNAVLGFNLVSVGTLTSSLVPVSVQEGMHTGRRGVRPAELMHSPAATSAHGPPWRCAHARGPPRRGD